MRLFAQKVSPGEPATLAALAAARADSCAILRSIKSRVDPRAGKK
jgi:hypothetical protein